MTSQGYALAREELIRALTAYSGITTSDGAADGTTLVDSNLIGKNDFITEKTIVITSGDAQYEDKGAASFNNVNGNITLQGTGFSAQIKAGTIYRVLNISSVEIDVANMDAKIGTAADPAGTTTLFAWLAKLLAHGGGLVHYGKVTQVDDSTHFRAASLTGFGDAYFANNYRAYVVRDAAGGGAAPQGEMRPCSAYDSTAGIFTHTAFSVSLAVDDEVLLLHERVAEIKDLIDRLTAARAGYLDELAAANIPADIDELKTSKGRQLFSMDFWSDPAEEVQLGDAVAGATVALPTVTVGDLPSGATIVRAIAMFKFRMIENTNVAANKLNGATVANTSQVIQVRDDTPGTWTDAINFVDDQFGLAAETREDGDVLIGSIDIAGSGKVDANDGYNFQWLLGRADLDYLNFNDVQCGLRIWYSV